MDTKAIKDFEAWFFTPADSKHIQGIIDYINGKSQLNSHAAVYKPQIDFVYNKIDKYYFDKCEKFYDIQKTIWQMANVNIKTFANKQMLLNDYFKSKANINNNSKTEVLNEFGHAISEIKVDDVAYIGSEYRKHSESNTNDGGYGIKILLKDEIKSTLDTLEPEHLEDVYYAFNDNSDHEHANFGIHKWAKTLVNDWYDDGILINDSSEIEEYSHRISVLYPLLILIHKFIGNNEEYDFDISKNEIELIGDGVSYTINYNEFLGSNILKQELVKEKLNSNKPFESLLTLFSDVKIQKYEKTIPKANVVQTESYEDQFLTHEPLKSNSVKENNMNIEEKPGFVNKAISIAKEEGGEAGKRIAVDQTMKTIRSTLIEAIASRSNASKKEKKKLKQHISEFLNSEMGEVFLYAAVGSVLPQIPIPGLNKEIMDTIGKEIRVQGLVKGGTVIAEYFAGPLREVLKDVVSAGKSIEDSIPQQLSENKSVNGNNARQTIDVTAS